MFDFVHRNKRMMQILLAIIVLPFAFWGMDSYTRSSGNADFVAKVNDSKITQQEFSNALRQQQDRLQKQLGEKADKAMLESIEFKQSVLENLVAQRVMLGRALDAKMRITDENVARVIAEVPDFQSDGKFDKNVYQAVLAKQGLSPLGFEARIRNDLLWEQIQGTYLQNGYASKSTVEKIIRLNEQERTVSVYPVSYQTYLAQTKVDEDKLKKYYNENLKAFEIKEQAKVEYVKFSIDDLLSKVVVSDEEMLDYYESHKAEFGTPEERKASHILISVPASAAKGERETARKKAEQLIQELVKDPSRFSDLAKKNSDDPGSSEQGGDLGYFARGAMVKAFEDAVFSLKPGEIGELVTTEFGYHIIKLTEVKVSKAISFEASREIIKSRLLQQKSTALFAELADKFGNTVYEQSDTLQPAADLVGVKIKQSDWLFNKVGPDQLSTKAMLDAIFNDEVLKNKRNTAAIEVSQNTLVAARLIDYKPSAVKDYSEVHGTILQQLQHKMALELANGQGKKLLEQLRDGESIKINWDPVQTITRSRIGALDTNLAKIIFQTNPVNLPYYVGVESDQQGFLLARIDAIKDGEAVGESKLSDYFRQLRQLTGEEIFRAYLLDSRKKSSVVMNLSEATPTN